ncbi:hypothetical protein CXF59_02250 [Flavobacterium sp. ALD4]|uniref:hypothetical protein n=1 Tax=Flavobacterium sp. ALD4 TaxID=2058314 RepID=UPI000C34975F|nr:hypothetical protein [Flavobacterium sp. ALD4]PKH69103.1 hypothetical protein CXF59_02250 [Flavobacterium sp. ALD4]
MKKILFIICSLILISWKEEETVKQTKFIQTVTEKNARLNNEHPKQTKIINPKFNLKLLYGIWTYDLEGPHADFELTKKSFYVVDYDGNGDMPYIINQDTITVYYPDYVSVGIIKSVTKDTLKIDWDKNGIVNCVKWKQ